ncbi:MAG: tetratricopeptide repeat protein [Bryobacterales bacterium]|nr:tetratricopeptide repeat protein [Bryobacterales bacterium]
MQEIKDQWIWFVDDELIPALLRMEPADGQFKRRAASSAAFVKAVALHLEGLTEQALSELLRAGENPKHAAECYSAAGHIQFELERYDEAVHSYSKAVAAEPQSRTAHFNLGLALERLKRYREAAVAFERASELDPGRAEPRIGLGVCLLHLKKPKQAQETFEQCLNRDPNNPTVLFGKAVSLQLQWQFEPAGEIYRKLLQRNPNAEEVLVNQIAISIARKDMISLQECAERLQRVRPKSRTVLEAFSTLALNRQEWDRALQHCRELTEVDSELMEGWFNLGFALQKKGDLDGALKAYHKAASLRPDHKLVHLAIAGALDEKGDWEGARRSYERAIQAAPDQPAPLWALAVAYEKRNALQDAEKVYMRLVKVAPASADAWFRLGHLRALRGSWKGSAEAFEECTRIRGDWADAFVNLGVSYWQLGDRETAAQAFEMANAAEPGSTEILRAIAGLSLEMHELAKAEEIERKLADAGESTADLLYNIGLLRQKDGDHQEAARFYRQALAQKPKFSEALINLGHALRAVGEEQEARRCWRQAVEYDPQLADNYFAKLQRN